MELAFLVSHAASFHVHLLRACRFTFKKPASETKTHETFDLSDFLPLPSDVRRWGVTAKIIQDFSFAYNSNEFVHYDPCISRTQIFKKSFSLSFREVNVPRITGKS